jgi:RNA polymerase sigma factor (sigma-70 family)
VVHDNKIVLQGFARSIIRRKARLIARCDGFTARDLRDIEQELFLRLLQGLAQFDPEQGHINVFITTVVERSVAMLLRERWAKKRDTTGIRSLDTPAADGGGATDLPDLRDGGRDAERFDLAHDLAEVLAGLPAELRDLAERLKVQTVSQAARDLNVPRTTLLRQVERLRRCFEDAGLRIYL